MNKDEVKIVAATPFEISQIMELLVDMKEGLEAMQTDIDPFASAFHILKTMQEGVVLIAVTDDELVGAMGITPETNWWSSTGRYASDSFFFVAKEARGNVGKALMQRAIELCKETGLTFATGHQLSQLNRMEAKDEWYKRQGLKKVGSLFITSED